MSDKKRTILEGGLQGELGEERPYHWLDEFDERQKRLIYNSIDYARKDPAGLPGHNLMVIINTMATILDAYSEGKIPNE